MKPFIIISCLLLTTTSASAQSIGPIDIVVAKYDVGSVIFSGSGSAMAGEGSAGTLTLTSTGPISVTPSSYSLSGPGCPTWDENGRTPKAPTYTGGGCAASVTLTNGISPGTTSTATVRGHYSGHWSSCPGTHGVSATAMVVFNIHCVGVKISGPSFSNCGDKVEFTASGYPPGGQYAWSTGERTQTISTSFPLNSNVSVDYLFRGKIASDSRDIFVSPLKASVKITGSVERRSSRSYIYHLSADGAPNGGGYVWSIDGKKYIGAVQHVTSKKRGMFVSVLYRSVAPCVFNATAATYVKYSVSKKPLDE